MNLPPANAPAVDPRTTLAGLSVWVVEDDAELRALMLDDLQWRGAQAVGLGSAEALYRQLATDRCDIVVLDVGLPGEDGYAVAAHLRQAARMGIVMLTGRGEARDMAHGLAQGADLYLVKPLDVDVLAAALQSLRRRLPAAGEPAAGAVAAPAPAPGAVWQLRDDGWTLVAPAGAQLALTAAERGLLGLLLDTPGLPVGREQLIAAVAEDPWDFDPHRLDVLVHRLRTRTRRDCAQDLPLRAVRGSGYLFVPGT
ncbi:TPA: response regulator transcription factor [Stenotrophomonas maltophilia]|uniref:response regulator transcription factor n=1 Tax=Stenotrophomonas sp. TaxID=69392 RepID=UPI0028AA8239|nr:response regulator transcription factor [Stenotrophomonas sp.]HDS0949338.1 response regulator transcription factor [Stenotrophomonas maltophilia]HDS1026349.1 response regulator transcription factor [Stenotrophomonas maltophilia]HDS1034348.1 response regulator transcription factor [Stenotrophomonas maltophilia]HDS1039124.1 response regulator transcription factor [Stenotrophomonas maltophilia]HDS1043449.1 response regulator transcription factor [Stenotrophomonas maltophilia]